MEVISGSLFQTPAQNRMLALPQNAVLYPDCLVGRNYPHPTGLMWHYDLDHKCICTMIALTFGVKSLLFIHPLNVLPWANSHSV